MENSIHPIVGTHLEDNPTYTHSKYNIEDYFEGFVVGISRTPTQAGAHVCKE